MDEENQPAPAALSGSPDASSAALFPVTGRHVMLDEAPEPGDRVPARGEILFPASAMRRRPAPAA